MADERKISDLNGVSAPADGDEFVVVNKAVTEGQDAGASGQTSKITLGDLKTAIGSQGPAGAKGDTGAPGVKGDAGAPGANGAKGDTGAPGAKGDKGDAGAPGANGAKGDTGAPGANGNTGAPGAKGDKGDKGDTGTAGSNGGTGPVGPVGPAGPSTAATIDFPKVFGHVKFTGSQTLGGNTANLGIADHQFNIHSVLDKGTGKYWVYFATMATSTSFPVSVCGTGFDNINNVRNCCHVQPDAQDGRQSSTGKAVQYVYARTGHNNAWVDPARVHVIAFDENGD